MERLLISHPVISGAPGWPGNEIYEVTPVRSMEQGDINNSCIVRFHEHYGTHFDAPKHFNNEGPAIAELPFDYFFYEHPILLDIPKEADQRYEIEDFLPYLDELRKGDLLLLRSGFERYRTMDPQLYQLHTPAISPECACYLVDNFSETLKTICLDFMSLGSPSDSSGDSARAHQELLGCRRNGFVCVIEDAHLSEIPSDAKFLAAASIPLMMTGVDSGPVTSWVEIAG